MRSSLDTPGQLRVKIEIIHFIDGTMKRSFSRNTMLWLTILTLLWSSQGQGYVWCLAEGGQTHLEVDTHCLAAGGQESTMPALRIASCAAADEDCGACIDHAATRELLQTQQRLLLIAAPAAALLHAPVAPGSNRDPDPSRKLLALQTHRPPQSFLALRTTVLRC